MLLVALCLAGPQPAFAQLLPGHHYLTPYAGAALPPQRAAAQQCHLSDAARFRPVQPVVTDIKFDPGLTLGLRYGYSATRRLVIEAEASWLLTVCAIRQLEIKPDESEGDQPQYETTTMDAHVVQAVLSMTYFAGSWRRMIPYLTFGAGEHIVYMRQKGDVKLTPMRDRSIIASLGAMFPANDRLGIRAEVRDTMYNWRFDHEFTDPVASRSLLFGRPDFYNTTSIAGPKFQNDVTVTVAFMIRVF
jgi:hypothetical protein